MLNKINKYNKKLNNMRRNKKALYEKIMRNVSREVKKALYESTETIENVISDIRYKLEEYFTEDQLQEIMSAASDAVVSSSYTLPYVLLAGYGETYYNRLYDINPEMCERIPESAVRDFEDLIPENWVYTLQKIMK